MNVTASVNVDKQVVDKKLASMMKDNVKNGTTTDDSASSNSPVSVIKSSGTDTSPKTEKKNTKISLDSSTSDSTEPAVSEQEESIMTSTAVDEENISDGLTLPANSESAGNVNTVPTTKDTTSDALQPAETKVEELTNTISAANETTNDLSSPAETEIEDDEVRLAMEMAMAAAKNPHLSPLEIQKLVGEKNAQAKMINEFSKQNEQKIKQNQAKVRELTSSSTTTSWWTIAAKKAEEMKDRAERSLYTEQISNDEKITELRKTMKVLKKTLKAHRLQGNRVETRHAFKRQRMEKRLFQTNDKLKKTQDMFTNSGYNVQEYLKAMMRASKKWRKIGSDDELLLEAQLSRNMHQMLALEKQKVKCKKNTKELKKYLQRCKGWLSDKKAFCEMNIMTIDATQNSIMRLYEETLRRQDKLIEKCKSSDEFQNVDLAGVDLSHVTMPTLSYDSTKGTATKDGESDAMRGLPIVDSIRKKKGFMDPSYHSRKEEEQQIPSDMVETPNGETISRKELLELYYQNKQRVERQQQEGGTPELYVVANKDDESISSRLSDPDGSNNNDDLDGADDDESDDNDNEEFGNDAPWNVANRNRFNSTDSAMSESDKVPAA